MSFGHHLGEPDKCKKPTPINVIYKIQRTLRRAIENSTQVLVSGGIDNMEKYKYICGKIHTLDQIKQEISNLLNPKEPEHDDETNVTRLRRLSIKKKLREAKEETTSTNLEKLPTPTGWRLLVMPFAVKEETKGGIIIAQETLDRARSSNASWLRIKNG